MTVSELIEKLSQFPKDQLVRVITDGGWGDSIVVYKDKEDADYGDDFVYVDVSWRAYD